MAEPIFFNRNILDRDSGLPLVSPFYVKYGLTRLTDIAYSVVPGLLPDAAVHKLLGSNKYEKKTKNFMGRLRSALPAEWRRLINSDSPGEVSSDRNEFHIFDPKKNGKIPTIKLTTKKIYDILIEISDDNPVKWYQKWNLELPSLIPLENDLEFNIRQFYGKQVLRLTLTRAP